MDEIAETFHRDGFVVVPDFWPRRLIDEWEGAILSLYAQQARKLGWYIDTREGLDPIVRQFESRDKAAGYQVLAMLELHPAGRRLFAHPELLTLASLILVNKGALLPFGPHPFINLPSSKRLLYKWHAESNYYPKRRRFLNVWFPILRAKNAGNGTMFVAAGSHLQGDWPFVEYQGYAHAGQREHFVQYETPAALADQFEAVPIHAKPGDLVLFARTLLHTSSANESDSPSYASVGRIFDYSSDLTVAGRPEVQPYTPAAQGRPGMVDA